MDPVLVTGGTGVLGRAVVDRLLEAGRSVRVLSRRQGPKVPDEAALVRGDLATGAGILEAARDVSAIVHCASATKTPLAGRARRTDVEGTQRLLEAATTDGGSPHIVYISIVGVDRIPLGYYRAKEHTERIIAASGLPHTILRTTQFHDFLFEIVARLARLPALPVGKGVRFQPVDSGEVADRLVGLVASGPAGRVPDLGGPEVHAMVDLALTYLEATGRRKPVVSLLVPGRAARAFREGRHLVADGTVGSVRWEDWLRHRVAEG